MSDDVVMEVSVEEEFAIRRFLQEFDKECSLSPTGEDGVQLRGGIVSSYKLLPVDVLPEVIDWVRFYMEQRKSPHALADYLAHHVAQNISQTLMSIPHSNGTTEGSDKETFIDSLQLYTEVMEHLHELCNHLRDSDDYRAILTEANLSRMSYPVSVCGIKNTRRKMEDRHMVIHDLGAFCGIEDEMHSSYYAVFDGHGGMDAANYAASHLHWNIAQHPLFLTDLATAMKDAVKTTDQDFLCRYSRDGIKSGCTAICCIVRNHVLYMAWVGDSQAIVVRQGIPILCMEIHKPERQDERQRIEDMGGSVTYQDGWRVNNAVGVSRAIGDPEYKKWICSDAEVCTIPLNGTEDFLVVACDGLWDSMSPSDVTAVVYHHVLERTKDVESVATQLVHHAKDQGSRDNISAIVVFLRDPASLAMQAMSPQLSEAINMDQARKHNGNYHLESNGMQEFDDRAENLNKTLENNYFEESYGNPFASGGQSSAAVGGTVPEKTAYSELPTPPIEDVLLSDEFRMVHNVPDSNNDTLPEADQNRTTEIASDIVNAAIEAAVEICASESENVATNVGSLLGEVAQVPIISTKENEYSLENGDVMEILVDNKEVSSENMMELSDADVNSSADPSPNPFLQAEQQVPLNDPYIQPITSDPMSVFDTVDYGKNDSGMMFQHELPQDDLLGERVMGGFEYSNQPSQSDMFFSSDFMQSQETSPFGISDFVPKDSSPRVQENPFLSGHPDSLLLYHGLNMQTNLDNQAPSNSLFSLSEEAPSAVRSLQGVPEMLGISESVPGRKSPEVVSMGSTEKTPFGVTESPFDDLGKMQDSAGTYLDATLSELESVNTGSKPLDAPPAGSHFDKMPDDAFLDASLDNLRSLRTEQVTGDQNLLGMKSLSTMMEAMSLQEEMSHLRTEKPQDEPVKVEEHISLMDELSKPEGKENVAPVEQSKIEEKENVMEQVVNVAPIVNTSTETVESESLNTKQLVAEVIAKALPDETLTPAVVVESIPENVPEADGVTEDSDSEKDGGWKYVSGAKQPKKDSAQPLDSKAATAGSEVQPTQKEVHPPTDTVKRAKAPQSSSATATRKALANKPTTETKISTTQKQPASGTQTMVRKALPSTNKTVPQTKPLVSKTTSSVATRTPKTAPSTKTTSTLRPTTAQSDATKPATGASRTTSSAFSRPKSAAASNMSTMQKPTSTIVRKSKPVRTTDAAAKLPTSTDSSTLHPRRPSPATTTKTVAPRTTSTLPSARLQARKPVPNGEATPSTQTKPSARMDKSLASNTLKQSRPLATKASASITQAKETKETVNKEISKMPSPMKAKPVASSALPATRKLPQNGVKSTSAKPSTLNSPPKKQPSPIKKTNTLGKDAAPPKIRPSKSPQKTATKASSQLDPASESKTEKEKGSLEENTKETKTVDSGLASPESPVSPQLSNIEMVKESIEAGQCTNEPLVDHPELIQQ